MRKRLLLFGISALAALLLGACGSAGGGKSGAADAAGDAGATTPPPAAPDAGTAPSEDTGAPGTPTEDVGSVVDPPPVEPPPPSCSPGEVTCDGNEVVACMNNGAGWYNVETCGALSTCNPQSASCEAGCTPHCAAKECGPDSCGGSCGTCAGGAICTEYGQCGTQDMCVASGTGIYVGDRMKDITWTDTTNKPLQLHEHCGMAKAVFMMETAGW